MADVLLLSAPVSAPSGPGLALPALVGYLRSRDVSVEAADINQVFFNWLLEPSRVLRGLQHLQRRFLELNSAKELGLTQMAEYGHACSVLSRLDTCRRELELLRTGLADFADVQEFDEGAKNALLLLAMSPYYPETIASTPTLAYVSVFNPFSSADLLRAARSRAVITECIEAVLPALLERHHPRIVGISAVFATQLVGAFQCARVIKDLAPRTHVTLGGSASSIYLRDLQEPRLFDFVDSLVMDEGELPLEALHKQLNSPHPDLSHVPGLTFLSDGGITSTPAQAPVDMNELPAPAYDTLPLDGYLTARLALRAPFRLSRGCPWCRCSFCRTELPMERCFQQTSVEHAYEQLERVIARTGIRTFLFTDEAADPGTLESLARRLLAEDVRIRWSFHTRVSRELTADRCELFRKSGCQRVNLGIESFCDRILRLMTKGLTSAMIDSVLKEIGPHLPVGLYMMVGFPTETREEALTGYDRTREYLRTGLVQAVVYSPFLLVHGADVRSNPARYGVTRIRVAPESDLNADAGEFDCGQGMTRAEVTELYTQFLSSKAYPEFLTVEGTRVRLRFDLSKIRDAITSEMQRAPFATLADLFAPQGRDLRLGPNSA